MIKTLLLLLLFVFNSTCEEEPRVECPEDDVLYGYSDYWFDYVPFIATWEDCGRICGLVTKCNFWSWNKDEKPPNQDYCYLYETDTGLGYDPRYISGEKGCPVDQGC